MDKGVYETPSKIFISLVESFNNEQGIVKSWDSFDENKVLGHCEAVYDIGKQEGIERSSKIVYRILKDISINDDIKNINACGIFIAGLSHGNDFVKQPTEKQIAKMVEVCKIKLHVATDEDIFVGLILETII